MVRLTKPRKGLLEALSMYGGSLKSAQLTVPDRRLATRMQADGLVEWQIPKVKSRHTTVCITAAGRAVLKGGADARDAEVNKGLDSKFTTLAGRPDDAGNYPSGRVPKAGADTPPDPAEVERDSGANRPVEIWHGDRFGPSPQDTIAAAIRSLLPPREKQ